MNYQKLQKDQEIQLKRKYRSIHEFDTTKKYKVTFGEIDKAFRDIKKKVEDIKYLYASNDNEMVSKELEEAFEDDIEVEKIKAQEIKKK